MGTCLLFLLIQTVSSIEFTPVVVLDPRAALHAGTISANPFHKTTPNDFTDIIHDAIHLGETILVFVEETLSVEDISSRDSRGNPYKNIHRSFLEEKAKYIPRVAEPYKALKQLLPPIESNIVYIRNTMKPLDKHFKYHYLYFTEPVLSTESRVQRLRRHDFIISEAYNNLSTEQAGPVLVFYTGKRNPMQHVNPASYTRPFLRKPSDTVMMVTDKALIRLSGVVLQQGTMRTHLREPRMSARSFALRRLSTRMLYQDDIELDFNFEYLRDNWLLDSVVLLEGGEEVGRTTMGVGAPYDWSYFCSEPLIIVNTRDKSYVTISKYQVEPLRARPGSLMFQDPDPGADPAPEPVTPAKPAADDKSTFTNTQSCGTNFNCRILAGLFVASIVIGITFGGIMVMYDCRSNDRMDDASQKPLVIMAQL